MSKRKIDSFRTEKDSLGEMHVPATVYYGIQTARAIENFPISGQTSQPVFTLAVAHIKKATAMVNVELGCLDSRIGNMIILACDRILNGEFQEQFLVDVYQAGAGTSHHMNVNEVIANIAIEMLGGEKGDYSIVHPNDHVNYGQSTNDVYPTAMRIAALQLSKKLIKGLYILIEVFNQKAKSFDSMIKSARTHLHDAVPIRVGQEFSGYTESLFKATKGIEKAIESLKELGIGGTAVGTGINTHPEFAHKVIEKLRKMTNLDLKESKNRFEATQSCAPFVEHSGSLRTLAVELIRISNDLRLMNSGPNTGLAEIDLPAMQPGSSIMPGKVNPVIPEMMNMVCFSVLGNDMSIALAAQAGQFELNVMMPLIQYKLLDSIIILTNAARIFHEKCIYGITVNVDKCRNYAMRSLGIVTILNPIIGYSKAADIVKESMQTGKSVKEIIQQHKLIPADQLDQILSPAFMTEPHTKGASV
ncbi:MAG: aspartate ammonia-lyase [Candidatus Jettenia sp.]|uniref:Aspartate ammonia-lyase n=1 Tax=Candidatus Jettenia caeni TaxID=247490 RepID=I3INS7_9BACT|nr:MAG: aspartate ammonia-lyase [Candidatus Jettenia sp. AMX1]MBC6927522.1 aspartate ammonia-lyase [Candidatus Jettenia sp.]WKZ15832.1 MAG: aspartate ammonia-lyase [Candidatus Jettenia caeni]MCE7881361.1 aspartate ammonia-lyase [Candidatus Jettenia sp. AMX1]MCQ3926079.1 aspartate ammonia-lyase [Candidatus Jettenia sp.]